KIDSDHHQLFVNLNLLLLPLHTGFSYGRYLPETENCIFSCNFNDNHIDIIFQKTMHPSVHRFIDVLMCIINYCSSISSCVFLRFHMSEESSWSTSLHVMTSPFLTSCFSTILFLTRPIGKAFMDLASS